MKSFTALLLSLLLVVGLVAVASAQTGSPTPPSSPGGTSTTPEPARPDSPPAPPGVGSDRPRATGPDVNVDIRSDRRDESPSALPRTSTDSSTRIFGLSPTWAILLGAILFVVIILALVSMTRGGGSHTDTHIDMDRRL